MAPDNCDAEAEKAPARTPPVQVKIREAALDEKGQALLEFALVTVFVIIPVMIAIIDGSILFYKWVTVNNAAREGSRAGAIYQDSTTSDGTQAMLLSIDAARRNAITEAVEARIGPLAASDALQIVYPDSPCLVGEGTGRCGDCEIYDVYRGGVCIEGEYFGGGHQVVVTVIHHHNTIAGFVIGLDSIDIRATATMRIEPGGAAH